MTDDLASRGQGGANNLVARLEAALLADAAKHREAYLVLAGLSVGLGLFVILRVAVFLTGRGPETSVGALQGVVIGGVLTAAALANALLLFVVTSRVDRDARRRAR